MGLVWVATNVQIFKNSWTNIQLSLWIRRGNNEKLPGALAERLHLACLTPKNVSRFGGLSLGESSHLVNEVRLWRATDPEKGFLLLPDAMGDLSMPIWSDHVGSLRTRFGRFKLQEYAFPENKMLEAAWITICPP